VTRSPPLKGIDMRFRVASIQGTMIWRDAQFRHATLLIFLVGTLLRVVLAFVNSEANDNHLEVMAVLADENRVPDRAEMWEAFQPKLYHVTVAALWKVLAVTSPTIRVRVAQLVSCAAGVVTLWLCLVFLKSEGPVSAKLQCLAFSLLALNPGLIGINAQGTNDSFVIMFASLALYAGYHFLASWRVRDFVWMMVSAILAALSKGNGLVVVLAILLVFAVALWQGQRSDSMTRGQVSLYGLVFLVGFAMVVPKAGSYWEHYRRYGSPFVLPIPPAPFPNMFEKTFVYKPGVTSIVDSLGTFRLFDLLRTPISTTDNEHYPLHRTSLWSQLYGRAHFTRFDAWPPSWRMPAAEWLRTASLITNLGRLIFLCALFPTILLSLAVWKRMVCTMRWLGSRGRAEMPLSALLLDLAAYGYIAFIVVYSLRYRDFAVMKAIFIFPGLLSFVVLFARECEQFYERYDRNNAVRIAADTISVCLLLLYLADVAALSGQLGIQCLTS
jgi:Dolichyl-phosphate-mannose-protein mannosyltransferase